MGPNGTRDMGETSRTCHRKARKAISTYRLTWTGIQTDSLIIFVTIGGNARFLRTLRARMITPEAVAFRIQTDTNIYPRYDLSGPVTAV